MQVKRATVALENGLHARCAADFAKAAAQFSCELGVGRPGQKPVNAKSVVHIMMEGFTKGTQLEITACGENPLEEKEAVEALAALLEAETC